MFNGLITSIVNFYINNPQRAGTDLILLIFVFTFFGLYIRSTKKALQSKDEEIERLADDNRKYREVYLKDIKGMPQNEYDKISGERVNRTKMKKSGMLSKREKKK